MHITSYESLVQQELPFLAHQLKITNESSLIQVDYLVNETNNKKRVVALMDAIDACAENVTVHHTGLRYFASDLLDSTKSDMLRMDLIVLPVALVLFGVFLRARIWLVWIVPVVTILTAVSVWSILMRIISISVATVTPTIMMSLTFGLGIDYTLFLLSRYLQERETVDKLEAVAAMRNGVGHVIVLSGLTLMTIFLGMLFLPVPMLVLVSGSPWRLDLAWVSTC